MAIRSIRWPRRRVGLLVTLVAGTAGFLDDGARAADLQPSVATTVIAAPVSGEVRVRDKGGRAFRPLRRPRAIAVGSTVDTTRGRVKLTTATLVEGKTAWGLFSGGRFTVAQNRSGLTTLTLAGGRSERRACGRPPKSSTAAAARKRPKVLRTLRSHTNGRFRTRGRYSAATVRGTAWDTVDECFSTRTIDRAGKVKVSNGFEVRDLHPGQSQVGFCYPPTPVHKDRKYCISVLSDPDEGLFAFGIGIRQPPDSPYQLYTGYRLCVRAPSGTDRCHDFPLDRYRRSDLLIGTAVCFQDEGRGTYVARWFVNGRRLGIPLTFKATRPRPGLTIPCVT